MSDRGQIAVPRRATAWRYPWPLEEEAVRHAMGTLPFVASTAASWHAYHDVAARAAAHHARQTDRILRARGYAPDIGNEPWLDPLLFAWADATDYRVGRITAGWIAALLLLRDGKAGEFIPGFRVRVPATVGELDQRVEKLMEFAVRDSFTSLLAGLSRVRQGELKRYVWRTMLDGRVRPEHRRREGSIFEWSAPPLDGHPGEPPNCRCHAEPLPAERVDRDARGARPRRGPQEVSSMAPTQVVLQGGFTMTLGGWESPATASRWLAAALVAVQTYRARRTRPAQPQGISMPLETPRVSD